MFRGGIMTSTATATRVFYAAHVWAPTGSLWWGSTDLELSERMMRTSSTMTTFGGGASSALDGGAGANTSRSPPTAPMSSQPKIE
jgi:hypothetical protein